MMQDADNFRSKMNSVAYGTVMAKAAEDYKQVVAALHKDEPATRWCMPVWAMLRDVWMVPHAGIAAVITLVLHIRWAWITAQELLSHEAAAQQRSTQDLNLEDLRGDSDLEKLHRDRLAELQREVEKRQVQQRRGHGECQVISMAAPLRHVLWMVERCAKVDA
jgi:hypothetical protein